MWRQYETLICLAGTEKGDERHDEEHRYRQQDDTGEEDKLLVVEHVLQIKYLQKGLGIGILC